MNLTAELALHAFSYLDANERHNVAAHSLCRTTRPRPQSSFKATLLDICGSMQMHVSKKKGRDAHSLSLSQARTAGASAKTSTSGSRSAPASRATAAPFEKNVRVLGKRGVIRW